MISRRYSRPQILENLVVFDLETTGLSPQFDEIIQVAGVRVVDGRIRPEDTFFSYVRPKHAIDPFITDLTGISNRHVRNAPPPGDVLREFSEYCGNSLLVAHNGHRFDIPFLERTRSSCRLRGRKASYIDSMHLSWAVWGRPRGVSHGLDSVVARLRVRSRGQRRHDARGDVVLLAQCVVRLVSRLRESEADAGVNVYACALPEVPGRRGSA